MSYMTDIHLQLKTIQEEYLDLVAHGAKILDSNYYESNKCLWFIDQISGFWLERRGILNYCWNRVVDEHDCYILSAAINLKIESNSHYPFMAMGDYHLLHDPFLKLEGMLRAPIGTVNTDELDRQLRHVMKDTLAILTGYSDNFFFVNLDVIGPSSEADKMETIHRSYENFLKQLFETDDISKLSEEYPTYEEIEEKLSAETCSLLLFNGPGDYDVPLGERVDTFLTCQQVLGDKVTSGNQCKRFMLALGCMFSQALDTILTCISVGFYPYYRWEVPIKYFFLILSNFKDDGVITELISKTIGVYFLGNGIEHIDIERIPFDKYCDYLKAESPYSNLVKELITDNPKAIRDKPSDMAGIVGPIIDKIKCDLNL